MNKLQEPTKVSKKQILIVLGLIASVAGGVWGAASEIRQEVVDEREACYDDLRACQRNLVIAVGGVEKSELLEMLHLERLSLPTEALQDEPPDQGFPGTDLKRFILDAVEMVRGVFAW